MEARPGNGSTLEALERQADKALRKAVEKQKAAAPRERLLPLKLVEFKTPVYLDSLPHPIRRFVKGEKLTEAQVDCPKLFIDPELQAIVIGERHFPIGEVKHYERAKAA